MPREHYGITILLMLVNISEMSRVKKFYGEFAPWSITQADVTPLHSIPSTFLTTSCLCIYKNTQIFFGMKPIMGFTLLPTVPCLSFFERIPLFSPVFRKLLLSPYLLLNEQLFWIVELIQSVLILKIHF